MQPILTDERFYRFKHMLKVETVTAQLILVCVFNYAKCRFITPNHLSQVMEWFLLRQRDVWNALVESDYIDRDGHIKENPAPAGHKERLKS